MCAATLIRSSRLTGSRSEIDVVQRELDRLADPDVPQFDRQARQELDAGGADADRVAEPRRRLRLERLPETIAREKPVGRAGGNHDEQGYYPGNQKNESSKHVRRRCTKFAKNASIVVSAFRRTLSLSACL